MGRTQPKVSPKKLLHTLSSPQLFSETSITRSGYTVSKWNTLALGNGTYYAVGDKIKMIASVHYMHSGIKSLPAALAAVAEAPPLRIPSLQRLLQVLPSI